MKLNRKSRWSWGAGAFLSAVVLLVACDGSNLFDPNSNPFITPQISVSAPDGFAGDTLGISIHASASSNLANIQVAVRGAVNKDTTIIVSGTSASALVKVALPTILTDTLIFVSAVATDINGNVSKVRTDTASVTGPPAVVSVSGPDSVRAGNTVTLRIHAFGTRRIAQMDLTIRGAVVKDTTIFVVPPLNDVTRDVTFTIPAAASDTSVRVGITVKDVNGLSSQPTSVVVPLSVSAPTISVTAPATAAPGGDLPVRVTAFSLRKVKSVRIVLSGALSKDTTVTLVAPATNVVQDVSIRLPGDVPAGVITVTAYAIDGANVFSSPSAPVQVTVAAGAPTVVSVTGPDSVRSGAVVDIRVTATGSRPITELNIRFRGATNQDIRVPIAVPSTNVTRDVSITLPADVSDTTLVVTAVATDQIGALSPINAASTKVVRVTDVTAPTVSTTVNPGATSAGSTVTIRVNARDNVSLAKIGYAVINPAGDTIGITPTLVNTSGAVKDTTFSFLVPSTLSPRTVRVLGIGVDATGRRGLSAPVSVIVADSAAPTITFLAPSPGATLPLNDSIRVQIRVIDPTGIKSISLRGESVRVDSLGPTRTIQRFNPKTITFPINPGQPLPKDTTIIRYLNAIPDSISEPVSIIATASDSIGNTASNSTSVLVGGPRVELRNPINNAQVTPGGTLLLTAFAVDRSAGIDSVMFVLTGAQQSNIVFRNGCTPAVCKPNGLISNDSVLINQNYIVGAQTGIVTITAIAWNRNRVAGQSSSASVLVTNNAVTDAAPPQVRMQLTANDRVELSDSITVTVAAQDVGAAGLRRMGVVVIVTPGGTPTVASDTLYRDSLFTGSGRTGLQPATFKFTLADFGYTEVNLLKLPRTLTFNVHAFAVDTVGNVGCAVTNTLQTLPCDSINVVPAPTPSLATKWFLAKNTAGASQLVTVVPGFARSLQQGSVIADILVDNTAGRPRMFLSNQNNNRIDVLELNDSTFSATPISVGSEPWGLFTNNANNRLIVANSGGTNLSFVNTATAPHTPLLEQTAERLLTPNEVLFNIGITTSNGFLRYTQSILDFSDRPQFVAQDANNTILYSTKPTGASPDGSIRYLTTTPVTATTRPDSKLLFNRDAILPGVDGVAIAYIDSVVVTRPGVGNDAIELFDHVSGSPGTVIRSGVWENIDSAIVALRSPPNNSDIFASAGIFDRNSVGLSDTTYIAASGNRQFVGFGEGGVAPFARIWLWRCGPLTAQCPIGAPAPATTGQISDNITVQDLVGNASERVVGLSLNNDGQFGGARGASAAYFFSNNAQLEGDLRLQGIFSNGVAGGGGGVALHPSHVTTTTCSETSTAFVATVNRSIKIVDTIHFRERGEILIRDNIVGPLRAAIPLPGDNVGIVGTPDEILVKLYGVTGAGNAVIINVRRRDMTGIVGNVCQ